MPTSTTRLALRKPDPTPITGDVVNAALDLNANWDKVDAALGAVACTSGARPGSPFNGQMARETDTGNLIICTNTVGPVWTRIFIDGQAGWALQANFLNALAVIRGTGVATVLQGEAVGDTQRRIIIDASGKMLWGSGSVAGDTNLYRSAADTLKTDDNLIVAGVLSVTNGGASTFTGPITSPSTIWTARTIISSVGATSVSFTVPSNLRRLSVRWRARANTGAAPANLYWTINNDTNTRYHWQGWSVNGFAHTGAEQTGNAQAQCLLGAFAGTGSTAGWFGGGTAEFTAWDSPASTVLLVASTDWATSEFNPVKLSGNHVGFYTGAGAAFTSIQLKSSGPAFEIGSDFQLEGVYT